MSCVIAKHPARKRLLESHTLIAAISLPDELFYPVGAIPSAVVLRAHTPHAQSKTPTWFGYWKEDGLIKVKNLGRVDADHRWLGMRDVWLSDYRSRAEVAGRCVKRMVGADDEWCAEAYMETDYSLLDRSDFEKAVREYAVFTLTGGQLQQDNDDPEVKATDGSE
jgi:type I restriction enzyme M protein